MLHILVMETTGEALDAADMFDHEAVQNTAAMLAAATAATDSFPSAFDHVPQSDLRNDGGAYDPPSTPHWQVQGQPRVPSSSQSSSSSSTMNSTSSTTATGTRRPLPTDGTSEASSSSSRQAKVRALVSMILRARSGDLADVMSQFVKYVSAHTLFQAPLVPFKCLDVCTNYRGAKSVLLKPSGPRMGRLTWNGLQASSISRNFFLLTKKRLHHFYSISGACRVCPVHTTLPSRGLLWSGARVY